jgi:hypothetical protein
MTDTTITFIEPLKQFIKDGDVPYFSGSHIQPESKKPKGVSLGATPPTGEIEGINTVPRVSLKTASEGSLVTTAPSNPPVCVKAPVSIGSKKGQNGNTDPHPSNSLFSKIVLYYHLSNDKNWNFESYKLIQSVSTVEGAVSLNENLSENIIKYCMLFMMKSGVPPIWEDQRNVNGGCFSYKVYNKYVVEVWKKLVYAFCGGSLMVNKENMKYVNGITISPKKNFCILKIWFENLKIQNAEEVVDIANLSRAGVIFRAFRSLNH